MPINTIMLVDDDSVNNFVNRRLLLRHDARLQIEAYESGEASLARLQDKEQRAPDLILLDLNMPEMSGWQYLEAYIELKLSHSKIYLLTSSIDFRDKEKSQTFPVIAGFISKPLDPYKIGKLLGS